jgi:Asp-tRNA(Asn)/Glu-tRNA(Gln) amidotransferase A subunit family amidase
MGGLTATQLGEEQIIPTIGPLSTSLEGCKLFLKTIIDAKPWYKEPTLLPFPWREEDFFKGKKMKVAVMWDDGVVKPHPPVTRALQQVVEKLKGRENIEIVEWKPYKHDLAWEIIVRSSLFIQFPRSKLTCTGWSLFLRRRRRRSRSHQLLRRALASSDKTHPHRESALQISHYHLYVGRNRATRRLPRRIRCIMERNRNIHRPKWRARRNGRCDSLSCRPWCCAEDRHE